MDNLIYQLKEYVTNTDTNIEGVKLFCLLDRLMSNSNPFILEIENDMSLSSSFLNSSFGNIIDKYGYIKLKEHLKIKTNKSQFIRLSNYLNKYNELYKKK